MKDIAGVEIKVGDTVAGAITGYNRLRLYTVVAFTAKMVKLAYTDEWGNHSQTKYPDEVAVVKTA
jgi:hypothetical protein